MYSWNNKTTGVRTIEVGELLLTTMLRIVTKLRLRRILRFGRVRPFTDYFTGLEKSEAVRRIFGEKTDEVLRNLKVEFSALGGYMGVNPADGCVIVNTRYLNEGDRVDIYLDLIHELVHVKQLREGKELFDPNYSYVERPTEIEAYRYAVEEAKRMGLSDERICEYLKTEWMTNEDLKRLAKTLNVRCTKDY